MKLKDKINIPKFLVNQIVRPIIKETLTNKEVQQAIIALAVAYGQAQIQKQINE